jgi:hypothetical protein
VPPKGESPATGIARPPQNSSNNFLGCSTRFVGGPRLRRRSAPRAEGRATDLLGNPAVGRPSVAGSVARIRERRGLEHISVELVRIIEATIVRASGGHFGEFDAEERDRWLD